VSLFSPYCGIRGPCDALIRIWYKNYFRTINVQWTFLAVVAVPGINILRAVNTPAASTASTTISAVLDMLQE